MPLENLVGPNIFITNLVRSNPLGTDPESEGDDHLRGIKNAVMNSFPNINAVVNATPADLNSVATKAPLDSPAFTGAPTAPTAAPDTNTTQIATTAFVRTAIASTLTWQTVSRAVNTDYVAPATGLTVSAYATNNTGAQGYFLVNGVQVVRLTFSSNAPISGPVYCQVPAGATYRLNATSVQAWAELR